MGGGMIRRGQRIITLTDRMKSPYYIRVLTVDKDENIVREEVSASTPVCDLAVFTFDPEFTYVEPGLLRIDLVHVIGILKTVKGTDPLGASLKSLYEIKERLDARIQELDQSLKVAEREKNEARAMKQVEELKANVDGLTEENMSSKKQI
ncbi:hypothetical protein Tco_1487980 [Tanacetum coccineum]